MVYKGIRISEICYNFAAEINSIYMTEQILDYLISIDKTLTVFFNFNGGLFNDTLWDSFSSRLTWVPLALAFLFFSLSQTKEMEGSNACGACPCTYHNAMRPDYINHYEALLCPSSPVAHAGCGESVALCQRLSWR